MLENNGLSLLLYVSIILNYPGLEKLVNSADLKSAGLKRPCLFDSSIQDHMLKEKIIELNEKGYSWKQIQEELGCSEYPIMYWLHPEYRLRVREKQKKNRCRKTNWRAKLQGKIDRYKDRNASTYKQIKRNSWDKILGRKICEFRNKCEVMKKFGIKDVLEKFGTKTKCYLTGRDIDLTVDDYNLDHKIPVVQGGEGTLDNLGITIPIVNCSKAGMSVEEYLDLCEEVLRYNRPELFKDPQ